MGCWHEYVSKAWARRYKTIRLDTGYSSAGWQYRAGGMGTAGQGRAWHTWLGESS